MSRRKRRRGDGIRRAACERRHSGRRGGGRALARVAENAVCSRFWQRGGADCQREQRLRRFVIGAESRRRRRRFQSRGGRLCERRDRRHVVRVENVRVVKQLVAVGGGGGGGGCGCGCRGRLRVWRALVCCCARRRFLGRGRCKFDGRGVVDNKSAAIFLRGLIVV